MLLRLSILGEAGWSGCRKVFGIEYSRCDVCVCMPSGGEGLRAVREWELLRMPWLRCMGGVIRLREKRAEQGREKG